jgi:hypothetical protein
VNLSQLNAVDDNGQTFQSSQYLIMNSRCLHELKTSAADQVAAKMDMTDGSSIHLTDLGNSVLTLSEAVQTFEVESPMYNIKLLQE